MFLQDALGTMVGGLVSQQYLPYHLTHPNQAAFFIVALLMYTLGAVAVGAGISATIQNYRSQERHVPHWLVPSLTTLAGFLVGAVFVALLAQNVSAAPETTGGTTTNGTVTVHMGVNTFSPAIITIQKGSKLLLVDDGSFLDILANGEWANNTEHHVSEPNAPIVNNAQVNENSTEIGPFSIAGTYHIYCTVHLNMNLTVVVK
ncbi:MAG: hypothetical protein NVS4B11_32260 [Ktedonobacteraceae bacterium]